MAPRNKRQGRETKRRQRGAALLIMLTLIVLAASYTLLKRVNAQKPDILRAADSTRALGQAKAALMGYALRSQIRPGELPCPDYATDGNLDGQSDLCQENGTYVTLGRLPWVTLGTADLRDASGEQLWYTPALEFDGNGPINSETTAGLRMDGGTDQIAAVVIAPGPPTSTQARPQNPAAQIDPTRYLEDANRTADINFVTAPGNPNIEFNDQLIAITRTELLLKVETRVLGEIRNALNSYYSSNGSYFPNPAPWGSTDCDSVINQGLVPINISTTCGSQADWGILLPTWFGANNWNQFIWYAVAPACTQPWPNCSGSGFVTVNNLPAPNNNKHAIVIAPGPDLMAGQDRSPPMSLTDLLDDSENNDEADLTFIDLPLDSANNDQILVVAP